MASLEPTDGDVESAIARVLAAEADAAAAVAASRADAQDLLESARTRARRIAERAGERLQRLTLRLEADSAKAIEALEATTLGDDRRDHDPQRLQRIVDAIAAELTGISP